MYTDTRGHQRWRCWSRDDAHRGDALDLVIAVRHVSRSDAIYWLANRVGHSRRPTPVRRSAPATRANAVVPLDPAVVAYTMRCTQILWIRQGAAVRRWLHDRGLTDDVLRVNRVGADPSRRILSRPRGLPAGGGVAATFPALDQAGMVRYVQTRYLQPRPGQPKYDNPAARFGRNPRLAWLRPPVPRHLDRLLICEGIPDTLTAAQAGYSSVAMLGTHAADGHIATGLAGHTPTRNQLALTTVVDADPAGRAAGTRLASLLADRNVELVIVEPPDGLDLNGWAQREPSWTDFVDPPPGGGAASEGPRSARSIHWPQRACCPQCPADSDRPAAPA